MHTPGQAWLPDPLIAGMTFRSLPGLASRLVSPFNELYSTGGATVGTYGLDSVAVAISTIDRGLLRSRDSRRFLITHIFIDSIQIFE